ncbi:Transcription factor MYB90 [Entamoeba marina]
MENSTNNLFIKPKKTINPWTKTEDAALLHGVKIYGRDNWNEISRVVGTRTRKQCRERFLNHLDDDVDKRPWTKDEDDILLNKRIEVGNKWTLISTFLPGRTPNSVKNRFFGHLNRKSKKLLNKSSNDKPVRLNKTIAVSSVFKPVIDYHLYEVL